VSAIRNHISKLTAFVQARLSPEGVLGLHLTAGVFLIITATWIFARIASDVVMSAPLTLLDVKVSAWLHARATTPMTDFMFILTRLGSTVWVVLIALLVGLFLWRQKRKYAVMAIALTIPGGLILNDLLKLLFQRARPTFDDPFVHLSTYSFPSGHTMSATILYGLLAVLAISSIKAWGWRLLIVGLAVSLILMVGFSRIYLGAHYLSDVLAAIAEGLAWLTVCLTALETVRRRKIEKLKQ
jgi:undecaprenyl-diphosphatase